MKKILIVILIILFCLPSLAQYIPVPIEQSKQYKNEIEQIIKTQIPISKKNINDVFKKVELEKDEFEKVLIIEYGMDGALFDFYWDMIDTTEKYIGKDNIRKNLNEGDYSGELFEALIPYLKDNKINASKIHSLIKYAQKRQRELEKKYNYQIEIE